MTERDESALGPALGAALDFAEVRGILEVVVEGSEVGGAVPGVVEPVLVVDWEEEGGGRFGTMEEERARWMAAAEGMVEPGPGAAWLLDARTGLLS